MYIPKNLYKKRTTYGGEFTTPEGTDYIGPVIEVATGINFAGASLDNVTGEVFPVEQANLLEIEKPYNDYYNPTEEDYLKGRVTRYFIRNRNGKFIEMSREQWILKRTARRVTSGQILWTLKGPVNDGEINEIPFKGASTKNREALERLEKDYPGISEFFKSTSEFVR